MAYFEQILLTWDSYIRSKVAINRQENQSLTRILSTGRYPVYSFIYEDWRVILASFNWSNKLTQPARYMNCTSKPRLFSYTIYETASNYGASNQKTSRKTTWHIVSKTCWSRYDVMLSAREREQKLPYLLHIALNILCEMKRFIPISEQLDTPHIFEFWSNMVFTRLVDRSLW